MLCKECGSENKDNIQYCVKCGKPLEWSDLPLNGEERIKIIIFFIWALFLGAVPLLIALVSIYIMKKDKNFIPILNSKKYINNYLIILSIGIGIFACLILFAVIVDRVIEADSNMKFGIQILVITGICILLALLVTKLLLALSKYTYFDIMENHELWIVKNGIFADDIAEESVTSTASKIDTSENNQLKSRADELLKWNELLEKGIITKEEFNEAKRKILS